MVINYNSLYSGLNPASKLSTPKTVYDLNEQSLFEYSIDLLRESNDNMRSMLIESSITESFDVDFHNLFDKIISEFIDTINKIYNQFRLTMVKFFKIGGDDIFKKGEKVLENYKQPIKIDFPVYNYTNLDKNMPPQNVNKLFKDDFDILYGNIKNIAKTAKTADEASSSIRGLFQDNTKDLKVANMRREIIGADKPISSKEYADKLFMYFRNNTLDGTKDLEMSGTEIYNNYYLDYLTSKEKIKMLDRDRTLVSMNAKAIYKIIRSESVDSYNWKFDVTKDLDSAFNTLMKINASTAYACFQTIVFAYSIKLDAVKENYKQDRKIVATALQSIIKGGAAI